MKGIWHISLVVFRESVRGRLFAGFLLFLGLFFILSVYISKLSLGTVARVIQDTGMVLLSLVGLVVTILFCLYSMYQENERNELYVILGKIPRYAYLVGRFAGSTTILVLLSLISGIGIFLLTWVFGDQIAPGFLQAVYWSILEFTLLMAVGIFFFALGLGFTLNAMMVITVYVLGHSIKEAIESFVGLGVFGNKYHLFFVKAVSYVFPNFDLFDFRLEIVNSEQVPWGEAFLSSGYWLLYLAALLTAGSAAFHRRDL